MSRDRRTPLAKASHPTPKLRIEPQLVEALAAPLPLELVADHLARQPMLLAPVKLVLSSTGEAGVLAEIQLAADREGSEAHARDAIEHALAWLESESKESPALRGASPAVDLPTVLEALPWEWERHEDGTCHVNVTEDGFSCRVAVETATEGWLRVSTSSALKLQGGDASRTLPLFALETNARLRIARMSVSDADGGAARVVWDGLALEGALADAVSAVALARCATARALRALCVPQVASAYLKLRPTTSSEWRRLRTE